MHSIDQCAQSPSWHTSALGSYVRALELCLRARGQCMVLLAVYISLFGERIRGNCLYR